MKEKQTLYQTYPDLFTDPAASELVQVIQELDNLCCVSRPPASVNWSDVRAMYAQQATQKKKSVILPWRSLAGSRPLLARKAVLLPVMMGLILVTTAFAFVLSPLLQSVLGIEPSVKGLLKDNLFVEIYQSKTIDRATITLEEGYTDANQIILGYTVSPASASIAFRGADLSTQNGVDLSRSNYPATDASERSMNDGSAISMFFCSSAITGNPHVLDLRLHILLGKPIIGTPVQGPAFKILGTVDFRFTLPFHAGRVATPEQQVSSHGQTATLTRVVVSMSATSVTVHGLAQVNPFVPLEAILQAPGDAQGYEYSAAGVDGSGVGTFFYPINFFQKQGTWTLKVKQGTHSWVFHFVVPTAN